MLCSCSCLLLSSLPASVPAAASSAAANPHALPAELAFICRVGVHRGDQRVEEGVGGGRRAATEVWVGEDAVVAVGSCVGRDWGRRGMEPLGGVVEVWVKGGWDYSVLGRWKPRPI